MGQFATQPLGDLAERVKRVVIQISAVYILFALLQLSEACSLLLSRIIPWRLRYVMNYNMVVTYTSIKDKGNVQKLYYGATNLYCMPIIYTTYQLQ